VYQYHPGMKSRSLFATALGAVVLAAGCSAPLYVQPALPENQMALVVVEERASVEDVDGVALAYEDRPRPSRFWVAAGCRNLTVRYEETFFRVHDLKKVVMYTAAFGRVVGGFEAAKNTHIASYETRTPIGFHILARPGMKYWITSSFDGDTFMPRVALLDTNAQRQGVILPGQPCSAPALQPALQQ
jgi:hypothetical protein